MEDPASVDVIGTAVGYGINNGLTAGSYAYRVVAVLIATLLQQIMRSPFMVEAATPTQGLVGISFWSFQ